MNIEKMEEKGMILKGEKVILRAIEKGRSGVLKRNDK